MKQCLFDNPLYSVNYEYPRHQATVLEGLNSLREKDELIDVTLTVEGQTFKAHKVVLSACSDYFRAMFTDNMLESRRNEICLNGITAKGFLLVLEYAYTCKITLNLANVQDVLEAASHIQMLALIQTCSNYLEAEVDIDNCVDIVTIAETYSLSALKLEVYRFMSENLMAFSNKNDFYRLTFQQLESILTYDFPVDCEEIEVLHIVINWFFYNNLEPEIRLPSETRIMRSIHFKEITKKRLETTIKKIAAENKIDWDFYKIILLEKASQSQTYIENIPSNLLNSRGMELAILKIGGFGISGITNEITYSFASDSKWKHLTSIPHVEQCNFGTCVLNNELFIVGGCFNQSLQENIHPFGFKYSPLQNRWSTMAPMRIERCRFSLNVVGRKLYAVGGASEVDEYDTSTCERYDPKLDEWTMLEPLPTYLTQHAGASYEYGDQLRLFISGGMDRDNVQSTMYCYDVKLKKWKTCAPMLTARADHVMVSFGNVLFVCGGWQEDIDTRTRLLVATIELYSVEEDCWKIVTHVPTPRYHAGIIGVSEKIYFIGGFHSDAMFDKDTAAIEYYDIVNDRWSIEEKYPQDIWEHTCATLYIPKCRDDLEVMSSTKNV